MATILLLAFLLAAQDKPAQKCTLSGTVVSSLTGEPLNKVEVRADSTATGGDAVATTTSDSKGNFLLVDLAPGEYHIKGIRNGYLATNYGARRAESEGAGVTLEAGQELKDLQIKLLPFGVIAGTVRDADGEPLAGAKVSLLLQSYFNGHRRLVTSGEAVTDDLGQYRIANLQPGKYYARAEPKDDDEDRMETLKDHSAKSAGPPSYLLPTLYPGIADPSGAKAVEVGPGARVTGVDIPLVRSPVFRVTVRASVPAGMQGQNVRLAYARGMSDPNSGLAAHPRSVNGKNVEGDFEFLRVPPGSYILIAEAGPPQNNPAGVFQIDIFKRRYTGRIPVEVGSGDVDGVHLTVNTGTDVTGRIAFEGIEKADLTNSQIEFDPGNGGDSVQARVLDDHTFATGLYAGHYNIYLPFQVSGRAVAVKSIRSAGADVLADGLTVSDSGKVALEIVMAPFDGGDVEGVAVDQDGKPVTGATVVLQPGAKLRTQLRDFPVAATDQRGHYHFEGIQPGDYKLFAWDDVEDEAWTDPEFMREFDNRGVPVTVQAKGHANIQLHLLAGR